MPTLTFSHASFAWPDGRPLFEDLTFALPDGVTAVVGRNGIGKSTLVRLALGDLAPTAGRIRRPATVAHVPQDVALATGLRAADALGVADRVDALRAIEAGSADAAHYDALADDWTVEERATAMLATLGLGVDLDRVVGDMSGGEATLLAVGAALLARPALLVLDEPTNNLDAEARSALAAQLAARDGATLVVSHERALLEAVDRIVELREREDRTVELRWFGGALSAFEEAGAVERDAARRAVTAAEADVVRRGRELESHAASGGRRARQGERARETRRYVGAAADQKRGQAERTDARVRAIHADRLADARGRLADAREAIPRDRSIRVDLPGTSVPARQVVLEARGLVTRTGAELEGEVVGPERIRLAGRNGAGKTTLVSTLLGELAPAAGHARVAVPAGILRQRLDVLDDAASVVDNVRARAPEAGLQEVRDSLGRFRLRGRAAEAAAGTLSGGERFRAALACVLLARPEPRLLVLDEPTNSLDLESQAQLVEALEGYGGALLVISHDRAFVDALAVTREWHLEPGPGAVRDRPLA